jgi:glycosyl transferase family 25
VKVYVINLPKDKERRDFQIDQLTRLKLDFEIIKGFSSDSDISQKNYQKHKDDWQRPLKESEVACYFSHQQLWNKIIQMNEPALILEDDALLSKCVPDILDYVSKLNDVDYLNLEVRNRRKLVDKKGLKLPCCDTTLFRLYLDRTGTAGYILYPSGAKKLLQQEKESGIGLADAHVKDCYGLIGYQAEPAPIIQLDQCETYQISQPIETKTNIGVGTKPKSRKWRYTKKRVLAQIKQALQLMKYFFKAEQRKITINKNDFSY